jgi:hypothetical protein
MQCGTQIAKDVIVRIELTSTLTADDERRVASAVAQLMSGLLDLLPITYLLRIETSDSSVVEQLGSQANRPNKEGDDLSASMPADLVREF